MDSKFSEPKFGFVGISNFSRYIVLKGHYNDNAMYWNKSINLLLYCWLKIFINPTPPRLPPYTSRTPDPPKLSKPKPGY
jgi:hypothetical protein